MALLFSKVTLTAENGNTAQLLCGGIPASNFDLEDWLIYQKFICDNVDCRAIKAKVDSFLYGEGEVFTSMKLRPTRDVGKVSLHIPTCIRMAVRNLQSIHQSSEMR